MSETKINNKVRIFSLVVASAAIVFLVFLMAPHSSNALEFSNNKPRKMSRRFDKLDQIRHAALAESNNIHGSSSDPDAQNSRQSEPMAFVNKRNNNVATPIGRLEELKQQEAELAKQLAAVRMEKLSALRSKPLTIGIIGFGRFGQFIARTFAKHGSVVVTSRSDYTDVAEAMGVKYVPLDDPESFLAQDLDVVILATSIVSFESTVKRLVPFLEDHVKKSKKGPLVVDVLSVKEHAREIMLERLPEECDILCTHPMFGPDSGKNGWQNLNFVYEKTRVDRVVFDPEASGGKSNNAGDRYGNDDTFRDSNGNLHSIHEDNEAHAEAMDRIERFLSIWEEEGCRMVPMSCKAHDEYAANSQFITHLMGRILGSQGLCKTPIDTKGFESVLKLIDSTTADSFDLFYGLYKYNQKNSMMTIQQLQTAMEDVVENLRLLEAEDLKKQKRTEQAASSASSNTEQIMKGQHP
jgi:prephenate dehydrogenase